MKKINATIEMIAKQIKKNFKQFPADYSHPQWEEIKFIKTVDENDYSISQIKVANHVFECEKCYNELLNINNLDFQEIRRILKEEGEEIID